MVGDAMAFGSAGYAHLYMAAIAGDGGGLVFASASTTPLAATGTGLDLGAWAFAGIALLIVGLACTLLPARRATGAVPVAAQG